MSRSASARAGLLAAVLLAGCGASASSPELAASAPLFRAEQFFAGRTAGEGSLKIIFKDAQPIRVQGNGRTEADGSLVLDQVVHRGTRAPERRQWRIRPAGANRYSGTLSDATGPVQGEVSGNALHLSYPMKGVVQAEQWIYLQPGGRTALNRMRITKFGVAVAQINETIRKLD
jgi:hypothetical protein